MQRAFHGTGRRSLRLRTHDYRGSGSYYVTICTAKRVRLFGAVRQGQMCLSAAGSVVQEEWLRTALLRPEVKLDAFVVMPDHLHGIIVLDAMARSTPPAPNRERRRSGRELGSIIAGFKSSCTLRINHRLGAPGVAVWQRGYYEHVIRDVADLTRIRRYIAANPARWSARHRPSWAP